MHVTNDPRLAVASKLTDFRDVPLAEMPNWGILTSDMLSHLFPGLPAAPAPAAVFQSAI